MFIDIDLPASHVWFTGGWPKSRGSRLRGRRREARCGVRAGTGGLWSSSRDRWKSLVFRVIFGRITSFWRILFTGIATRLFGGFSQNKILGCLEGSLDCVWNDPNLPVWWWLLKLLLTWGVSQIFPNHWDVYLWEVGTTLRITSHY